jgi:carbamoyltransferase
LLAAFHERTGCPVLVNTSFNVRGEPIVCTPQDAYRCFLATEMDALVLGPVIVLKQDVAQRLDQAARARHLAQFHLD